MAIDVQESRVLLRPPPQFPDDGDSKDHKQNGGNHDMPHLQRRRSYRIERDGAVLHSDPWVSLTFYYTLDFLTPSSSVAMLEPIYSIGGPCD